MAFVAVHIGAGFHSPLKREKYQQICTIACEAGMRLLKNNASSIETVVAVIKCLEDEELTNAGYGSNLSISGNVECDASLMDGSDLMFGAVGALQSVKNPIEAAYCVLNSQRTPMPLGLIAPNFLVGESASKWAISKGCEQSSLLSEKAAQVYEKYRAKLDSYQQENEPFQDLPVKRARYDTVGAVVIDLQGRVASGVSSGGLILKQDGRVGQAAIAGAGCWAQENVAISTSGIGEYIVRTSLAKECAKVLLANDSSDQCPLSAVTKVFQEQFFDSPLMRNVTRDNCLAGVIALVHDADSGCVELIWAHSTATMCIGYMSSKPSASAKAFISSLPATSKPGSTVTAQAHSFRYQRQ